MGEKPILKTMIIFVGLLVLINSIAPSLVSQQTIQYNDKTTESTLSLPSSFSWRDVDGVDYTTSVKNQAPCPSCEAYGAVAALETMVQYEVGYPFDCDLSEMHLFLWSGGTCRWGVNLQNCTNFLQEYGVPDEGCFPDPHRAWDTPCNESLPGWENRTVKIEDWGWVSLDEDAMKQALIEYGPLVICVLVYDDFFNYKRGIYRSLWGEVKGGHVISLFGYDDDKRYWLVKNSWGDKWGEDGWIRVSYDAHRPPTRPFFRGFYGGTGVLYMDGVYGNFQPDVPRVYFERPQPGKTYFKNFAWPGKLLRKYFIKTGNPIIIRGTTIKLDTSDDTRNVEVYIDKELVYNITKPPFEYYISCEDYGTYELRVIAYNYNNNASMDIRDIVRRAKRKYPHKVTREGSVMVDDDDQELEAMVRKAVVGKTKSILEKQGALSGEERRSLDDTYGRSETLSEAEFERRYEKLMERHAKRRARDKVESVTDRLNRRAQRVDYGSDMAETELDDEIVDGEYSFSSGERTRPRENQSYVGEVIVNGRVVTDPKKKKQIVDEVYDTIRKSFRF